MISSQKIGDVSLIIPTAQNLEDKNKPIIENVNSATSKVTGRGHIPKNVQGPDEKSFNSKKGRVDERIKADKGGIATNPVSMAAGAALDAMNEVKESGKPYPMVPKGEQKRRTKLVEDDMTRKVEENFKN